VFSAVIARISTFDSNGIASIAEPCAATFSALAAHGYVSITPHEDMNISGNQERRISVFRKRQK